MTKIFGVEDVEKYIHKKENYNRGIILCITGQLFIVSFSKFCGAHAPEVIYSCFRNFADIRSISAKSKFFGVEGVEKSKFCGVEDAAKSKFCGVEDAAKCIVLGKNAHECILGSSLLFVYLFCMLLWSNPIRYSIIHRIDGVMAKTSIVYFITYTIACKKMESITLYSYYMVVSGIIINAYLSNYYSNKEWCSREHIYYHALLHIFCFIGSLYAF